MAVETTEYKKSYTCNGGTGPYAITFDVPVNSSGNAYNVAAVIRDSAGEESSELTIGSGITCTGLNVYTDDSYDNTNTIVIYRKNPYTRSVDRQRGGTLDPDELDDELDIIYHHLQELIEIIQRNVYIPISDDALDMELPPKSDRATNSFLFDADGYPIAGSVTAAVVSSFAQTVIDDESATAMLTTLGFSSFIQSLIDDSDAAAARATLQIAALPDHYERDAVWQAKEYTGTASERYTIQSPAYMTVNINNNGYVLTSQQELDLSAAASWDTDSPTDYTTAANRAGKDFYIYAVEPASGTTPDLILSANSSYPSGYTADNSRKVGGFHCLCVSVGTISGHDLTDYVQGDILPCSVWDLKHRPVSDPEGMVWDENSNVWFDIYLASWSSGLQTTYNATIVDGGSSPKLHWYNFVEEFAELKKRLPTQQEFLSAALGSPQETNISGSADPGTTGGHSDTASQRIISNIGCEDMTGVIWQWGADGGATNDVGSAWAVADTAGTADSLDNDESIGRGQHYEAPNRPLFGGNWSNGADCGSRGSYWSNSPLDLDSDVGARGAAEPKR